MLPTKITTLINGSHHHGRELVIQPSTIQRMRLRQFCLHSFLLLLGLVSSEVEGYPSSKGPLFYFYSMLYYYTFFTPMNAM